MLGSPVLHTQLLTAAQVDPPRKRVSAPLLRAVQPVILRSSILRIAKAVAISALCPRVIIFATTPEGDASASTAIVITIMATRTSTTVNPRLAETDCILFWRFI